MTAVADAAALAGAADAARRVVRGCADAALRLAPSREAAEARAAALDALDAVHRLLAAAEGARDRAMAGP